MHEQCISPLDPISAKSCLVDFIERLKTVLDDLHFQHCDIRLENICFRRDSSHSNQYGIVLIDLEFLQNTSLLDWKSALWFGPMFESMLENGRSPGATNKIATICNLNPPVVHNLSGKIVIFSSSIGRSVLI